MTNQHPTTNGETADPSSSLDGPQRNDTGAHGFFRGELTSLWPVCVLALLMLLVILWDRFVQF